MPEPHKYDNHNALPLSTQNLQLVITFSPDLDKLPIGSNQAFLNYYLQEWAFMTQENSLSNANGEDRGDSATTHSPWL